MLLSKIQCYAKTVKQLCRQCSSSSPLPAPPLLPLQTLLPACLPSIKQELQLTHCSVIISLLFLLAVYAGVCEACVRRVRGVAMCVCRCRQ